MRLFVAGLAMLLGALSFACLWDSDTVAVELKGMPELQDVIAGRFERNPDLYYEMRLARIEKKGDLVSEEDIFDAAVACDRLGRHDEAIEWIEVGFEDFYQRRDVHYSVEKLKDIQYKRAANLGTFYIHRGLTKGEEGLKDLEKGLGLIEAAIEINPDAHFGREKVQVALVRHLIWQREHDANVARLESEGKEDEAGDLKYEDPPATGLTTEEIREGVIGLMVLGNAWEAPVAWEWLVGTYDEKDSHIAVLIEERILELDPKWRLAYERMPTPLRIPIYNPYDQERTHQVYSGLRKNGKEWAENREEFMLAKLKAGKHPDTDEDFWDGYVEVPKYEIVETIPGGSIDPVAEATRGVLVKLGSCFGVVVLSVGGIWWLVRRNKKRSRDQGVA